MLIIDLKLFNLINIIKRNTLFQVHNLKINKIKFFKIIIQILLNEK